MKTRLKVKEVVAKKKYVVTVCFEDGVAGDYDLAHLAGKGVFTMWDEGDNFFKVAVNPDSGAITWPGELDIDTVTVYCSIRGISVNEYLQHYSSHAQAL